MVSGAAAAGFLIASPALFTETVPHASADPCVNGVIPWNPLRGELQSSTAGPRIRGAAPDAGAIIACRDHPGCLSWYVNGPW